AHARRYTAAMTSRFALDPESLVVEVASNDGYLLRHFQTAGLRVLGVEPAANVAAAARAIGVPTEIAFFGRDTARALVARHGQADQMVANNVLAHVPDLFDFAAGFAIMLRPQGVATFEFPHVLNLLERVQFDTIYHEHYAYLSLLVVERLLLSVGLRVFDVEQLATHGGSLRVYACHLDARHPQTQAVQALRQRETDAELDRIERYHGFSRKVAAVLEELRAFAATCHDQGRRLAAYGAAAKGNTLLNCAGLCAEDLVCVADRNPAKQGKLLPGSHVPVVTPEALIAARPDDLLILPWNIAPEIIREMQPLRAQGTRFWAMTPMLHAL
ncbi:MAG: methyltransferase domain-containing protein, partial [Rhodospirillales bacterium]|nr:methyltransferase domain-containing protein [Rhodospirillales bacterium]